MITCKVGDNIINCYDGLHSKEQLKKWASRNILICPACGKTYEYCHGEFKSPYFRHKDKCECEDRYSEPESQEHINGKRDLYEWIKNQDGVTDAVLEGWLPDTKQRPDIMFKYNGKQYVIEYQCTPIASEYVERHELYQAGGIEDIWILGTKNYFTDNSRIKEIEKTTPYYYDSENKWLIFNEWIDISDKEIKHLRVYLTNEVKQDINEYGVCKSFSKQKYPAKYYISINDIIFTTGLIIKDNIYDIVRLHSSKVYKDQRMKIIRNKVEIYKREIFVNNCKNRFNYLYHNYLDYFKLETGNYSNGKIFIFNDYKFYLHRTHLDFCEPYSYTVPFTGKRGGIGWKRVYSYKNIDTLHFEKRSVNEIVIFIMRCLKHETLQYMSEKIEMNGLIRRYNCTKDMFENADIKLVISEDYSVNLDNVKFKYLRDFNVNKKYILGKFVDELLFLIKIHANNFVFMIPNYKLNYESKNNVVTLFNQCGFKNVSFMTNQQGGI